MYDGSPGWAEQQQAEQHNSIGNCVVTPQRRCHPITNTTAELDRYALCPLLHPGTLPVTPLLIGPCRLIAWEGPAAAAAAHVCRNWLSSIVLFSPLAALLLQNVALLDESDRYSIKIFTINMIDGRSFASSARHLVNLVAGKLYRNKSKHFDASCTLAFICHGDESALLV